MNLDRTPPDVFVEALRRERVIAILRLDEAEPVPHIAAALLEGGVHMIEITMTMPAAVRSIADLSEARPDAQVGAGSVFDAAMAHAVIDAGACFVVGPVFCEDVCAVCHERRVAYIPGAFTPTEIHTAMQRGADLVKVFPSSMLAPRFIRDVLAPMPALRLVPTGGVGIGDAARWLEAGAWAVGIGNALIDPAQVAQRNWKAISVQAALLRSRVEVV